MLEHEIKELEQKIQMVRERRDALKAESRRLHDELDFLLMKQRAIRAVGEEGLQKLVAGTTDSTASIGEPGAG